MKKIFVFIILFLFLLLLWFSYNRYQTCCGSEDSNKITEQPVTKPVVQTEKTPEKKQDGSLLFNWKSDKAHENEFWGAKKAGILSGAADGKILEILGPYFKEEGKEMGVARAKAVFAKLTDKIDAKKVEFGAKLVEYYDGAKTTPFSGTHYAWLIRNDNITQIDSKTLIYFPTNSTKKISNANIINYLKDVANALKGNDKKVFLSGHSDSRGNDKLNKKLALGRANSIKNELIHLGVSADRISTISYGEEKPIASNDTKEGQQKNRRVELEIK